MKIAYYSHYVGKEFARRAGMGQRNGGSGSLKTQGMARALLKAGNEVTIYSPGITECGCKVDSFEEIEHFPEGDLHVKYPTVYAYRHCNPLNELGVRRLLKKDIKKIKYDAFVFYNIETAFLFLGLFDKGDVIRILEYEDNVMNVTEMIGMKSWFRWRRPMLFNYTVKRSDAAFAVCKGMLVNNEVKYKLLTPAVINEEVINHVNSEKHSLRQGEPTRIFLIGGGAHCKGTDVLVNSLHYVKNPCHVVFYTNPVHFYSVASTEIASLPNIHKVEVRDLVSHTELMQVLNDEADILCSCTRSFELPPQAAGFPSKMMEYAAMGRPTISSEIGKLDEEFNSRITYYEGEDPKSLAMCIDEVIENYEEKNRLSLELQKIAIRDYSIDGTARKMKLFLQGIKRNK